MKTIAPIRWRDRTLRFTYVADHARDMGLLFEILLGIDFEEVWDKREQLRAEIDR